MSGKDADLREFNNQTGRFVEGELSTFAYDFEGSRRHSPNPTSNMTFDPKMSYIASFDETWWLGEGVYLSEVAREDTLHPPSSSQK
ncbi:MAG: hypothetical protein QCH35_04195 [Methanomicrobiaceae archaeon]|nr:hypothetical protein [Methanomicrobiaceae archaeon]